MVTRIMDRSGNILADFTTRPGRGYCLKKRPSLIIDMMRGVVDNGTGIRIRNQFEIRSDVAGKTGTTQGGADGWFIMMHPQLVTGSWVGFNDSRIRFRPWWGEGSHNALLVVGDFFSTMSDTLGEAFAETRFIPPAGYDVPVPVVTDEDEADVEKEGGDQKGRIGW